MIRPGKAREASLRRHWIIAAFWALILALVTLVACGMPPDTPVGPVVLVIQGTPVGVNDQATLEAAIIQDQNNSGNLAKSTAMIERAYAQSTMDSANATLSAAQIQQQNNADAIAAQNAAAAAIVRANAQATLVAADSTQNAALTQDSIRQTQVQYDQQVMAAAASTQTVVANLIATQTQSALATSQWYADQSRQRQEQSQRSIALLWTWGLPIFLLVLAVFVLWGLWFLLKIRQANQRVLDDSAEKLPAPIAEVIDHRQDDSSRYLDGNAIDRRYQLTKPVDQARRWLDEVKRKLIRSDEKDEDDNSDD